MDIAEAISETELLNVWEELAELIMYGFNAILKIFFNDIQIFGIPIGYLLITMIIVSAIAHSLMKNDSD